MASTEAGKTSGKLKIFISYSRADYEIAHQIVHELEQRDFTVRIDTRDLPFGEEWQKELAAFIQESDTIIWLVSEKSVKSHWCNWELAQVIRMQKRFLPVVIREVPVDDIPKAIGDIHLLPVGRAYDPEKDLEALITALNTDRGWIRQHTRLTDRALEWINKDRPSDMLLRGSALREAITWKDSRPRSAPAPGKDVMDLILQSQRASARRQKLMTAGAGVVAVALGALSVFSFFQMNAAIDARTETARRSAMLAAGSAEDLAEEGLTDEALLILLDAAKAFPQELPDRLTIAFQNVLTEAGKVEDVYLPEGAKSFPLGDGFAIWDEVTGEVSLLNGSELTPVTTLSSPVKLIGRGGAPGELAVLGEDWSMGVIDIAAGTFSATGKLDQFTTYLGDGAGIDVNPVELTPDGLLLVTSVKAPKDEESWEYEDATVLADPKTGKEIFLYGGMINADVGVPSQYARFPDGRRFLGKWVNSIEQTDYLFPITADFELADMMPVTDTLAAQFNAYACVRVSKGRFATLYDIYQTEGEAYWQFVHQCISDGESLIVSDYQSTSAGMYRDDQIVLPDGSFSRLDDLIGEAEVSTHNRDWIDVRSVPEFRLASTKNRYLTVMRENPEGYPDYIFDTIEHPYKLEGASFTEDGRGVSVAVAIKRMIRTHRLSPGLAYGRREVSVAEDREFNTELETKSPCIFPSQTDLSCTFLSPDGTTVVTYGYDQPMKLGPARLDDNGELLEADGSLGEILPKSGSGDEILAPQVRFAADGSLLYLDLLDSVIWSMRADGNGGWTREEVFRSEEPLVTFELLGNRDDRLIVVEALGGGDVRALLWSRSADMEWMELGQNYKWLQILPMDRDQVAFGKGAGFDYVFKVPTRAEVLTAARSQLSEYCVPAKIEDPATSACWPL